jgi:S1-C subfamily serine protease
VGLLAAVGLFAVYHALLGEAGRRTDGEIEELVTNTLEEQPAPVPIARAAHQRIGPSVVRVRQLSADESESGEQGVGTGFVVDASGRILTSLHVVAGAERVGVRYADGTEADAEIVGAQPENDLAVLQASLVPETVPPATLASSESLQLGDDVVAVGNPFGIGHSVSAGVISGLERSHTTPDGDTILSDLIQFDAAVNPGNSGGPLVNARGEVVGVVTAIFNPTEDRVFVGIGFAVPIETAAAAAGPSPF